MSQEIQQATHVSSSETFRRPARCRLGDVATAVVTIIDDDLPGVLSFTDDDFYVKENERAGSAESERRSSLVVWLYLCTS